MSEEQATTAPADATATIADPPASTQSTLAPAPPPAGPPPPVPVRAEAAAPPPPAAAPAPPEGTAAEAPSSDPSTQGTWSPSGDPTLVFIWSVLITDDPARCDFAVQVAFDPAKAYVKPPPGVKKQVFVDTKVTAARPVVPFSMSTDYGSTPFIHGELCYEPGVTTSSLTVVSLTYPGGSVGRQVLYPSV